MKTSERFTIAGSAVLLLTLVLALWGSTVTRAADPTPTVDAHASHHPVTTETATGTSATATSTPEGGMAGTTAAGEAMNQEFDLMFIDMTIAHRESEVAMAQVALQRGEHQEVRDLAQSIIDREQAQIDQLTTWRNGWYPGTATMPMDQMVRMMSGMMASATLATPTSDMGDMAGTPATGTMADMMQMMDPKAEAQALDMATGPFDRAFLQAMIPHHQCAVMMAEAALQHATHPEIERMAQGIIDTQQREIGQMQVWLAAWYGASLGATPTSSREP